MKTKKTQEILHEAWSSRTGNQEWRAEDNSLSKSGFTVITRMEAEAGEECIPEREEASVPVTDNSARPLRFLFLFTWFLWTQQVL